MNKIINTNNKRLTYNFNSQSAESLIRQILLQGTLITKPKDRWGYATLIDYNKN